MTISTRLSSLSSSRNENLLSVLSTMNCGRPNSSMNSNKAKSNLHPFRISTCWKIVTIKIQPTTISFRRSTYKTRLTESNRIQLKEQPILCNSRIAHMRQEISWTQFSCLKFQPNNLSSWDLKKSLHKVSRTEWISIFNGNNPNSMRYLN